MGLMTLDDHNATLVLINNQRHDGDLCDVKLNVENGQVLAHKAVLAACSTYFNTMFTGGFREGDLSLTDINMSKVFPDFETAEHIIESMYTGQLDITSNNVCVVFGVCSFLMYDGPVRLCEDFMARNLNLDTCMEYWRATHHDTSGKVHISATELLKTRFHDHFIYRDCLLDIPVGTLLNLLNSEINKFCSSKQILNLFINWFVNSGMLESNILMRLVLEANLPAKLTLKDILGGIRDGLTMRGIASEVAQDICMDVQGAICDATEALEVSLPSPTVEPRDDCETDSHMSTDVLKGERTEQMDVLLAVSPSFTCVLDNKHGYGQLRICAYVPQSRLWLDICTTDYPSHDNGAEISVSQSQIYAAGECVFLLPDIGNEVFFLPIPSHQWSKVKLPNRDYAKRQVFPLPLKSTMFLIIIDQHIPSSPSGQVRHTLTLGRISDVGIWEEVLQHEPEEDDRMANAMYGPCWVEQSCFFVYCSARDSRGHCANKGIILMFNPQTKNVSYACYTVDANTPSLRSTLGKLPLLLEHGDWIYGWDPPSAYCPVSEVLRFRMSDDASHLLLERQTDSFPDVMFSSIQEVVDPSKSVRSLLRREKPSCHVYTTVGANLWRLSGIEQVKSSLHEMSIENLTLLNEHTPPPCNVILAATTASLDSTFLSKQPQAQYHQIHDERDRCV